MRAGRSLEVIISVPLGGYAPTIRRGSVRVRFGGGRSWRYRRNCRTRLRQLVRKYRAARWSVSRQWYCIIGAAIIGFRFAGTPSEVPDLQRSILAEFSGPRLAVGNFQSDQQNEDLAQGLKVDIQAELLRFDWLGVYVSSFGDGDEWTQTDVHYLLNGSIRTSASGSVFVLKLVGPKSGQFFGSTAMILATVQNAWSKLSRTRQ